MGFYTTTLVNEKPHPETPSCTQKTASRKIFSYPIKTDYKKSHNPLKTSQKNRLVTTETASGIPYWPSRDPIKERGGVNLYSFVRNQPINRWDKLGLTASVDVSPDNVVEGPDSWRDAKPLKNMCRPGFECKERNFRLFDVNASANPYYRDTLRYPSPESEMGNSFRGQYNLIGTNSINGMIETLRENLKPCECIKTLTIIAHGMYGGGFYFVEGGENSSSLTSRRMFDTLDFAYKIKPALCKDATIILFNCDGGSGEGNQFAQDIQSGTDSTVIAFETAANTQLINSNGQIAVGGAPTVVTDGAIYEFNTSGDVYPIDNPFQPIQ